MTASAARRMTSRSAFGFAKAIMLRGKYHAWETLEPLRVAGYGFEVSIGAESRVPGNKMPRPVRAKSFKPAAPLLA